MRSNRLAGHELPNEGRVWNGITGELGNYAGDTTCLCSCGVISPYLLSTSARKKWHAAHKDQVRAAKESTE